MVGNDIRLHLSTSWLRYRYNQQPQSLMISWTILGEIIGNLFLWFRGVGLDEIQSDGSFIAVTNRSLFTPSKFWPIFCDFPPSTEIAKIQKLSLVFDCYKLLNIYTTRTMGPQKNKSFRLGGIDRYMPYVQLHFDWTFLWHDKCWCLLKFFRLTNKPEKCAQVIIIPPRLILCISAIVTPALHLMMTKYLTVNNSITRIS